jgi:lysophospholipid acyltransferase (LPLAT)-like uncharacterized protein
MQSIIRRILGLLIAAYMGLVKRTTRWDWRAFERVEDVIGNGQGLIALTWHSRFLMLNAGWKRGWQMPHVMISRSKDGDIVHYASRCLGIQTVRGSSKKIGSTRVKGGERAAGKAVNALQEGGCLVITPDGPRGPRQRVQIGALRLARLTGAPIVPCSFAVSKRKVVQSWDRTVIPKPFGRGIVLWGEPVHIPVGTTDTELEILREVLEARMNTDLAKADQAMGHAPSEAA